MADFPWRAYACVLGAAVACYAALGAVLRVMPTYVPHSLGGGSFEVGLAVGAPSITGAVLRPLGGRWADRFGSRPMVITGAIVMTIGVVPAVVSSYGALIASRLLIGAAEAVMMSAAVVWLLRLAGANRRGRSMGHIGLANYAGLTLGPLLVEAFGAENHPGRVWVLAAVLPLIGAAAVLLSGSVSPPTVQRHEQVSTLRMVVRTGRPGIGLLLVNVGYVAVLSFGSTVVMTHGLALGAAIVPVFAGGVIVSRAAMGSLPDRLGAVLVLAVSVVVEGAGLCVFATSHSAAIVVGALIVLAIGQGLAVPSLGVLAIGGVSEEQHGAAAGAFFAWFDGGVGLGGPAVGALARLMNPQDAVVAAGVAVIGVLPVVLPGRVRRRRDAEAPEPERAECVGSSSR
jgi:MFS family permease